MDNDISDFLCEYDEVASDVLTSTHQTFSHNLRRWFAITESDDRAARIVRRLESGVQFDEWYAKCCTTMGGMVGSATLNWPTEIEKLLGLQIGLFKRFSTDTIDAGDFAIHFLYTSNNLNDMVSNIASQYFNPFHRDLRRYLVRHVPQETSEGTAPAADRTVRLDHNSAPYHEAMDALQKLEEVLQRTNDYPDADDKEERIAEVSAGRRLLQAVRVRPRAVLTTVGSALLGLAAAFKNHLIGIAATAAWDKLAQLFGSLWTKVF